MVSLYLLNARIIYIYRYYYLSFLFVVYKQNERNHNVNKVTITLGFMARPSSLCFVS